MGIPSVVKRVNVTLLKDWLTVIAILSAGIWALYTLVEKNQREDYLYRGRAIAIASACNIDIVGETKESYLVKIVVKIASAAKIRFYVFDSPYEIAIAKKRSLYTAKPLKELSTEATEKFRQSKPFSVTGIQADIIGIPLQFGRLWDSSAYLEPNERAESVQLAYIGKKTLENFEAVSFVSSFVLAENLAQLGAEVVVKNDAYLDITLLVYDSPKLNYFAYTESKKIKARIPAVDATNPKYLEFLRTSNVAIANVECQLISPSYIKRTE